ncbi:MAG: FAD binding domain-containing protein [Anaerolineae bacterium]|nr:FAD binding domain-containing protein [Anaerolineae bacterium]
MAKQPTAYYRPNNLSDALRLLQQANTVPLAGGSKLLAADITDAVVDLQELGLNQTVVADDQLKVGATMTLAALTAVLQEEAAPTPAPLLLKAIHQAGPNTYRNAATLGGSIASRLADSELLAALLVLDATLVLNTPDTVQMSLADYLGAAERPFGLITAITIPWQTGRFASERVARTPGDYPIVSVTLWQADGASANLAATGIAARPIRLHEAEKALVAGVDGVDDSSVETAVAAAKAQCTHPGDFRGDTSYRADMVAVLTRRVVATAYV